MNIDKLIEMVDYEEEMLNLLDDYDSYKGHAIISCINGKQISNPLCFIQRSIEEGFEIEFAPVIEAESFKEVDWLLYDLKKIKSYVKQIKSELLNSSKIEKNKIKNLKKVAKERGVNIDDFLKSIA
jgi:hypothetical protein